MVKKTEPKFKFNLGDEVVDKITSFKGIVVYRTQWIHNCNTYGVRSKELKDGVPMDYQPFDEPSLERVKPKVMKPKQDTGGPTPPVRQTNR